MTDIYWILTETNTRRNETWHTFILVNQENTLQIRHLKKQLGKIRWFKLNEEPSIFSLDISNTVSEQTAIEMCSINTHNLTLNRKFDRTLKHIDFEFKQSDTNQKRIEKVFDVIGMGKN
jgi:hypothetical protein